MNMADQLWNEVQSTLNLKLAKIAHRQVAMGGGLTLSIFFCGLCALFLDPTFANLGSF